MKSFVEPILELEELFEADVLLKSVPFGEDPWGDDFWDD